MPQIQLTDNVEVKDGEHAGQKGTVVGLYNNGVDGVLVRFGAEDGSDEETLKLSVDNLRIVFGYGVFRDQAEHDAMLSDFREEFTKLESFKDEVARAQAAEQLGDLVGTAEKFGLPLGSIKGLVNTLQYATNFIEVLADSPRIDAKSKVAIKIAVECVRLLGRVFSVKEF